MRARRLCVRFRRRFPSDIPHPIAGLRAQSVFYQQRLHLAIETHFSHQFLQAVVFIFQMPEPHRFVRLMIQGAAQSTAHLSRVRLASGLPFAAAVLGTLRLVS
jgi:hypothetical protein